MSDTPTPRGRSPLSRYPTRTSPTGVRYPSLGGRNPLTPRTTPTRNPNLPEGWDPRLDEGWQTRDLRPTAGQLLGVEEDAASTPGLGPRATTGQIIDWVSEHYPGMMGFFNSNPEIRAKLTEAAKWGWTPNKLEAEIQSTSWYRSTSANARDFALLEANDPASAQARVSATAAEVQNIARTLGLGLSGQQLAGMAWNIERNGWNSAQTIDALLRGISWESVGAGELRASVDDIKALSGDYLVTMTDRTAQQYAMKIASGEMTLAGVETVLKRQAQGRFNWMANEIDQGITPMDYFAPIRDTIASTLELAPEAVNLMDPQWLSLVEVRDEETGKMRGATINEAMLKARNTAGWADTSQAQEMSAGALRLVQEAFGR